ncbi:MAG: DEAD/DEAH box helicase, partial [Hasllibacter sp.]
GRAKARMPRSLVLAPTRELAMQVAESFEKYGKYHKLSMALLIGGVSFKDQEIKLTRGVDVLVATPGRLLDHHERGKLLMTGIEVMVVDEADRMLDMGFIPDLERIFNLLPFTRQTLFFSATMALEIERITKQFLNDPEKIEVARAATTGENIAQSVVMFRASRRDRAATEKRKLLRQVIDGEGEACTNAIVFCNRKTDVDVVAKSLKKYGYNAAPIHGDLDQSTRMKTLAAFRDGELRFLVASDVAARGLDIPAVSHVFNYDVPSHAEDYVHRIGRTGRAGRSGTAIMLCSSADERNLQDVERLIKNEIPRAGDAPAEAPAQDAPEGDAPAEDKPKRSRSRSRSRSKKDETPAAAETERDDASAGEREEAPKAEAPAPAADEGRDERSSRGRSRGGRGRGRREDEDRGPKVVGMGDHLPGFIEKSFEERLAS